MTNDTYQEPQTTKDYHKLLERGRYCINNDLDNEAMRIFCSIYDKFSNPKTEEETEIYIEAANGIIDLRKTDNEYIWELTSRYVSDYISWLEHKD